MANKSYNIKFSGYFDSASLQTSINSATAKLKPIKLDVDINTTALQQRINSAVSNLSGKSAKDSASTFIDFDKINKRASTFTATLTQMSNAGKINTKQLGALQGELDGIVDGFSKGNTTLYETNSAFDEFGNKLKTVGKNTGLLNQNLTSAIAKFTA